MASSTRPMAPIITRASIPCAGSGERAKMGRRVGVMLGRKIGAMSGGKRRRGMLL